MGLYLEIRDRCPSCKTTEAKTLFEAAYTDPIMRDCMEARGRLLDGALMQGLEGVHEALEECARCGLIYQREIPTELLMGRLYGSREGDAARHADKPPRRELSYFVKHARQIGGDRVLGATPGEMDVLDFGMGWGDWCRLARGLGCRACGTDVSPREDRARAGVRNPGARVG